MPHREVTGPLTPRVVVHENVVRRSVNLETGPGRDRGSGRRRAGGRALLPADRPVTGPSSPAMSLSRRDARGRVSTQRRRRRTKLHPFLRHGR